MRRLGLTQNEAKIYLALTEAETAETAKNLSIVSEVAREIVYQTMPRLQQKGLVEKIIDKTTLYRAVPIEHAVANLLKQKSQEQQQLRKQIKQLLHRIKDNRNKQSPRRNMETQFKIVPGKEVIVRRLQEALQNTQFSLDVITSPERFIPAITAFADGYKAALQRGVKIRIATQQHNIEKTAQQIINSLKENSDFEVRYFPAAPHAIVTILDEKEAYVTLSAEAEYEGVASLWSNNRSLLELARSYFENKWIKATTKNLNRKTLRVTEPLVNCKEYATNT